MPDLVLVGPAETNNIWGVLQRLTRLITLVGHRYSTHINALYLGSRLCDKGAEDDGDSRFQDRMWVVLKMWYLGMDYYMGLRANGGSILIHFTSRQSPHVLCHEYTFLPDQTLTT